ncbi:DUF2255 family protein [Amycolatopsis sp. SID8362]|uniref:DUF2255 family protein n=1 Tax=Amycolatopsis sp. SID8362 TaxID=2690346 RepID=UPI00136C4498|nr:DUF2255 family protein [Amycolatopsis sp. SID8362]NBH06298.1 DUF2255 family protein [Amycolatopsis sp. SID8362]NED42997.1 DUF2255 family protein [Amycolatopsis sp. SID8362]
MAAWTPEDLTLFAESPSLVLTAGAGGEPGVELGMAVVGGELYVRAYRGVRSRWYQAAREHGRGRIEVGGAAREVVLTTGGFDPPAGLEAAFAGKYGPVSDALVATPDARAATVRIDPEA